MKLNQVRLLVDNFEACKEFYKSTLGLEVTVETDDSIYAQFLSDGVSLGLYQRDLMASVVSKTDASAERAGKDTALLVFAVDDVDASYQAMKKKGIEFVSEPHNQQAWFMRVAHLRDPDGNLVEIFNNLPYEAEEANGA